MNSLESLKEQLALTLTKQITPEHKNTVMAAFKGIEAFIAHDHEEAVGEKAQEIADVLAPLVLSLVPGGPTIHTVVSLFEPHLGDAIDWLGKELAPIKVTDKQTGAVVHDDGDDAPVV